MDCPRCEIELLPLDADGVALARCPECAGVWVELDALNRLLLRANMPGLESLGGRANPDDSLGLCPECKVDLLAVEGGKQRDVCYDTCEVCGGIFVDTDTETEEPRESAKAIVSFFKEFAPKAAK